MAEISYKQIEGVKLPCSEIFYGAGCDMIQTGEDHSDFLESIFRTGINTFDTARRYGLSEKTLGIWVEKRGRRDDLVILSKCCHPLEDGTKRVSREAILEDYEISRGLLGFDFIDIYLLHRDDPEVEVGPIVETLNELKAKGAVGVFGGSNWQIPRIEEANEYAYKHGLQGFTVSSPNFCLADQITDMWGGGGVAITGPNHQKEREWYVKTQMPVVAYSSLGHGMFTGRMKASDEKRAAEFLDEFAMKGYACPENFERLRRVEILSKEKGASVPQIAMSWLFRQQVNVFAVVATTKASRMQENIDALEVQLTDEECRYLDLETDTL